MRILIETTSVRAALRGLIPQRPSDAAPAAAVIDGRLVSRVAGWVMTVAIAGAADGVPVDSAAAETWLADLRAGVVHVSPQVVAAIAGDEWPEPVRPCLLRLGVDLATGTIDAEPDVRDAALRAMLDRSLELVGRLSPDDVRRLAATPRAPPASPVAAMWMSLMTDRLHAEEVIERGAASALDALTWPDDHQAQRLLTSTAARSDPSGLVAALLPAIRAVHIDDGLIGRLSGKLDAAPRVAVDAWTVEVVSTVSVLWHVAPDPSALLARVSWHQPRDHGDAVVPSPCDYNDYFLVEALADVIDEPPQRALAQVHCPRDLAMLVRQFPRWEGAANVILDLISGADPDGHQALLDSLVFLGPDHTARLASPELRRWLDRRREASWFASSGHLAERVAMWIGCSALPIEEIAQRASDDENWSEWMGLLIDRAPQHPAVEHLRQRLIGDGSPWSAFLQWYLDLKTGRSSPFPAASYEALLGSHDAPKYLRFLWLDRRLLANAAHDLRDPLLVRGWHAGGGGPRWNQVQMDGSCPLVRLLAVLDAIDWQARRPDQRP